MTALAAHAAGTSSARPASRQICAPRQATSARRGLAYEWKRRQGAGQHQLRR